MATSAWTAAEQTGDSVTSNKSSVVENWRVIIKNASIFASGTQIRIKVAARTDLITYIDGSSIGLRDGTSDTYSATPTRILWDGGNNATTIAAGATKWSDWVNFTLNSSVDHLVHNWTETSNDHQGLMWNAGSGEHVYYDSNNDDLTMTLNPNGSVVFYIIGLEEIEVQTPVTYVPKVIMID